MKIPETSANIGAYYGNEDNGQWQPNGVIVDGGVGGGVVGSGDAGYHPPVYQIQRPLQPGFVMSGPYYEGGPPFAPPPHDDFADYMWMENEEEFDKQVMQQLEEEALMEQCIEAMLEDEQRERQRPQNGHPTQSTAGRSWVSLEEAVSRSTLNPLAKEFVPTGAKPNTTASKEMIVEVSAKDDVESKSGSEPETSKESAEEDKQTDQPECPPPTDPQPSERDQSHNNPVKVTEKKRQSNVTTAKSETKVPSKKETPSKKDTKTTKSEMKLDDSARSKEVATKEAVSKEAVCPAEPATPVEEDLPKPINYAAAAKANKGKKPSPAPVLEKTPPPSTKSTDRLPTKDKTAKTTEQKSRKNTTK